MHRRGRKGRKLFSYAMSTHCDNVATHLAFKQEAKVGRKHTVHPSDDISSETVIEVIMLLF